MPEMNPAKPLIVEQRGAIALLTLNRPDDANSIDVGMAQALLEAARSAADDHAVRALVVTGAGRLFCAGGDIKSFDAGGDPAAAIDAITGPLHAAIVTLTSMDKPLITLVNGPAAGAGLGLAIAGDLVVAARSAHFTSAYTAIGLTPDGGTSWFLPRRIGLGRALDLVATNRRVGAEEAERIGLIDRIVEDEALVDEGLALAERLATMPAAVARSRRLLAEGLGRALAEQLDQEARNIAERAASPEGRQAVERFLRKTDR